MKPGFLIIDKPPGITSHDVVAAVRAVTGIEKVGHTGTLDPFATGVLPLALGHATKLIQYLDESEKVYDATITLGARTDTGDLTGAVVEEAPLPTACLTEVEAVLSNFLGDQLQTPPAYSAVKKDGKPLYWYARKGEEVEVPARPITLHSLRVVEYDGATLRVLIHCSRGTYARVLAEDFARALGSAGHLSALCRPRSGPFHLEDALSMPELAALVSDEPDRAWQDVLLSRGPRAERVPWRRRDAVRESLAPYVRSPIQALAHLPMVEVSPADAARVARGAPPPAPPSTCGVGDRYLVVHTYSLIALAERTPAGGAVLRVLGA